MNLVTSYTFPLINNHKSSLVLCAFKVSRVYGWGASVDVDASAIFSIYVSMLRYVYWVEWMWIYGSNEIDYRFLNVTFTLTRGGSKRNLFIGGANTLHYAVTDYYHALWTKWLQAEGTERTANNVLISYMPDRSDRSITTHKTQATINPQFKE